MKLLCIHAHYDDYEFVAAGTFELWRRKLGSDLRARVLICTDGAGGHHCRTREETAAIRYEEQTASSRLGQYEFELLRLPDGTVPREATLHTTPALLPALWKAIRDFEPDYLFCPPVVSNPLVGVHVDHLDVAEAVRRVAYLINVPHAFTPEYPADETDSKPCQTPVIINVHDSYMAGSHNFDFAVNVEEVFDKIVETSYCHQSQISEWLPWVGRHQMAAPKSLEDWGQMLRTRFAGKNAALGLSAEPALEVFTVTAWGVVPTLEQLLEDFPPIANEASNLESLKARLETWRGGHSQ